MSGEVFIDGEYNPKDCVVGGSRAHRVGLPLCEFADKNTAPQENGLVHVEYIDDKYEPVTVYVCLVKVNYACLDSYQGLVNPKNNC